MVETPMLLSVPAQQLKEDFFPLHLFLLPLHSPSSHHLTPEIIISSDIDMLHTNQTFPSEKIISICGRLTCTCLRICIIIYGSVCVCEWVYPIVIYGSVCV